MISENDDNEDIAPGQTDFDSGFSLSTLGAGEYLLTVATYDNFAQGELLSSGFLYDNQPPVLLADWDQPANNTGMGSYYRVHLDGVDSATNPVPVPGTMTLFGIGILGLAACRRRESE